MRDRQERGDRTAPQLQKTSPADDATDVAVSANLTLTFNEAVKAGSGFIQIRKATDGSLVQNIAITDASKVNFVGNQLTINPGSDLSPDTNYYVTFVSGVVRDLAGNAFAGISSGAVFSFTTEKDYVDTTGPVILFTTPDEYVSGNQNIVITFNEPVRAGSGEIEIRNAADDALYLTIPVDDGQVAFSGRTVTINPIDFLPIGSYYVAIAPSAFEDLYGNDINGAVSAAIESFGVVAVGVSATAYGTFASAINQGAFASASASGISGDAYAASAFASAVGIYQSVSQTVFASEAGHIIAGNDVGIDMADWNYDAAMNGTLADVTSNRIDILGTDGLTYRIFGYDFNTAATTVAGVGGRGIGLIEVWAGSGADAHIVHVEYNRFQTLQQIASNVINIDAGDSKIIGSTDDDVLFGFAGDDLLIGRDGDDVLHGDEGSDTLIGGLGTDKLYGGAGHDDFVFVSLEELNGDTIEDIGIGDRIDLSAIDGLLYSGSRPPTPFAGEVRNVFRGGNTYVLIDSNGDGVPDAELRLNGGQFGFMDPQPGSNVLVVDAIFPAFGLTLTGDGLRNTLVGGISQDVITGAGQADTLTGGTGPDRFVYNARTDSASRTYDTITDFNAVADVVDLWFEVTGVDAAITSGALSSTRRFDSDLAAAVSSSKLGAHHAVLFTPNNGGFAGSTFLIIDANGTPGYQSSGDMVILLGSASSLVGLDVTDFV
jgi:Ca2+-binding RTX toxin-like protein